MSRKMFPSGGGERGLVESVRRRRRKERGERERTADEEEEEAGDEDPRRDEEGLEGKWVAILATTKQ